MKKILGYISILILAISCAPVVPEKSISLDTVPILYPQYADVTIPCNIAPLTFRIEEEGSGFVTRFSAGDKELVIGGKEVLPPIEKWQELLSKAAGNTIKVDVYAKKKSGWEHYLPFEINVSSDSIDSYISYRLIPPSYVAYEDLSICQRNLSTFEEEIIYSNKLVPSEPNGRCSYHQE